MKTREEIEKEIYEDLKEIIYYYGGLDGGYEKVKQLIQQIKDNEEEAAFERYYSRY